MHFLFVYLYILKILFRIFDYMKKGDRIIYTDTMIISPNLYYKGIVIDILPLKIIIEFDEVPKRGDHSHKSELTILDEVGWITPTILSFDDIKIHRIVVDVKETRNRKLKDLGI